MMQVFRNAAKPVIYVLTVSFFAWLVWDLSGLGSNTGGILTNTTVGKVNGQSIDLRAFDQQVQNQISAEQQRTGAKGRDAIEDVRNRVWDQVVQQYLLDGEFKRLGLAVSDDEIADAIRNVPPPEAQQVATFQTNAKFDIDKYQRWLRSAEGQAFIPGLELQYKAQLLQAKLFRSVVSDVFVSDATLWERFRDERERVKVGMVRIDPEASVNDQVAPVTAQEAEAYYNGHKDEFERKQAAYLSYITVSRVPIASDTVAAAIRAKAIRAEIIKGAPFEEVATRESSDSASRALGGDLGEVKKTDYPAQFSDVAMTLPLNTLSEPVLTSFGYHIIKVESRKGDTFKARHVLIPIEVTGTHREQLDAIADSLETLAAEKTDPAAIDTAARALHLTIEKAGPVLQGNRVVVAQGVVPDAGVWAFQAKPGEHSEVIEAPNAFFVFRLDSLQKKGIPAFGAVKAQAEAKVRLGKKTTEAKRLAEKLAKQIGTGTTLAQAAKTMGFDYREVGPFARLSAPLGSPVLIGAAFGTQKGQISPPIDANSAAGESSDRGVYLFEGLDRTAADSAEFVKGLVGIRQQALSTARRSRVNAYVAMLKDKATLVDKRSEIYKTAAQNAALTAAAAGRTR